MFTDFTVDLIFDLVIGYMTDPLVLSDPVTEVSGSLPNIAILANGTFKFITGNSETELLIKERLLIHQLKPRLNGNIGSSDLLLN